MTVHKTQVFLSRTHSLTHSIVLIRISLFHLSVSIPRALNKSKEWLVCTGLIFYQEWSRPEKTTKVRAWILEVDRERQTSLDALLSLHAVTLRGPRILYDAATFQAQTATHTHGDIAAHSD